MTSLRAAGAARVIVATYLLAPGYFADKIRDGALGAGAAAVSGVLGAAPEVADVVLRRYRAAVAGRPPNRLWPGLSYPYRKVATSPLGIRFIGANPIVERMHGAWPRRPQT